MKKILLGAAAIGTLMALSAPAQARDWRDDHRGSHGHYRHDRGGWNHGGPGRAAWVDGRFYPGRGYWSNGRWWQHRDRWHNNWRYR